MLYEPRFNSQQSALCLFVFLTVEPPLSGRPLGTGHPLGPGHPLGTGRPLGTGHPLGTGPVAAKWRLVACVAGGIVF